jgi:hypothetical protein
VLAAALSQAMSKGQRGKGKEQRAEAEGQGQKAKRGGQMDRAQAGVQEFSIFHLSILIWSFILVPISIPNIGSNEK